MIEIFEYDIRRFQHIVCTCARMGICAGVYMPYQNQVCSIAKISINPVLVQNLLGYVDLSWSSIFPHLHPISTSSLPFCRERTVLAKTTEMGNILLSNARVKIEHAIGHKVQHLQHILIKAWYAMEKVKNWMLNNRNEDEWLNEWNSCNGEYTCYLFAHIIQINCMEEKHPHEIEAWHTKHQELVLVYAGKLYMKFIIIYAVLVDGAIGRYLMC